MQTIIAAMSVSESGSVVAESYTNSATYEHYQALSTYGSPYMGTYETSEEWRSALGDYASVTAREKFNLGVPQGWHVAYVDGACSLYVFEIDY